MPEIIDLSLPIRDGEGRLGLENRLATPYTFENCGWQGTTFTMFAHMATHIDAPVHFIKGGKAIYEAPLERLIGPAGLVELDDHGRDAAITGDTLEDRARHLRRGDIIILRTGWSDKCWGTPSFWKEGPFLVPNAADWLAERGVRAVVYDFAEEYVVRQEGFRGEDCLVHHRILGEEIYNIEYVHCLSKIKRPRLAIIAFPLKLVGSDGSPARVVAIEGHELPSDFAVR